jgi:hypothetical protein
MTATHPTDRDLSEFLLGKLEDSFVESHLADWFWNNNPLDVLDRLPTELHNAVN